MKQILVVDDDPFILEGIKRGVRACYTVVAADSGEEGLRRLLDNGPFVAVVSDQHMPGLSGLEFLERARSIAPETPRVMLTGFPSTDVLSDAINRVAAFRFLQKPVARAELLAVLSDCDAAYAAATRAGASSAESAWIRDGLACADFDAEFALHFQPIVDARSGIVLSAEALLRWTHPSRGPVSPLEFIPVAERDGSIRRITKWVLQKTGQYWNEWNRRHGLALSLSVNVSPALFASNSLVEMVTVGAHAVVTVRANLMNEASHKMPTTNRHAA